VVARLDQEEIANRLLLSLPKGSLRRLEPALEFRTLTRGEAVNRADQPVGDYYFVNRGLISLVKTMEDGRSVEIGIVGIEGLTTAHTLFGFNRVAIETVVKIPGNSFVIKRDALMKVIAEDSTLRTALQRYVHFAYTAVAQTAACNRLHYIEERCCRWLLIAHDNARADTFQLTHEFLAMMLGVQRSGVTIAANFLQKAGLISYLHGQVTIRNRAGLEEAACECYRSMRSQYQKIVMISKRQ
jgi:CRP-like cAMP-binding protein